MRWWSWAALGLAAAGGIALMASDTYEIDALSRMRVGKLTPETRDLAEQLLRAAAKAGMPIVVTAGLRTMAEQQALYERGRTAVSQERGERIVTNAKPGSSAHNYGAAIDVAFLVDGKYSQPAEGQPWARLGNIGESLRTASGKRFAWGGRFTSLVDRPHFELSDWRTLRPVA